MPSVAFGAALLPPTASSPIQRVLTWTIKKAADMAGEKRARRAEANIQAFLQHRITEQRCNYLARGRRFIVLDVAQLSKSWIAAVGSWLALKDRAAEATMDDLTAELRLRGLEPPYEAIKQELASHFGGSDQIAQKKAVREFARQIGMFIRKSDRPLY
jgi:hypothetical protein